MKRSVEEIATTYDFVVEKEQSFRGTPPGWPWELMHYEIASLYIPLDSLGKHVFTKNLFENVYSDFREYVEIAGF